MQGIFKSSRMIPVTYLLVKVLHFLVGRTECGKDDHISFSDSLKVLLTFFRFVNELNIHPLQLVVDLRVVDKLVGDVDFLAWKVIDGLVGESDGSLDTPAKTKILREMRREISFGIPLLRLRVSYAYLGKVDLDPVFFHNVITCF